jgi:PAS domain-containing protein
MNLDGQLIYSNERCRNVTGLSPAEICQTPLDALFHPDDRNMVCDIIRQAQVPGRAGTTCCQHGRHVPPPRVECLPLFDDAGG